MNYTATFKVTFSIDGTYNYVCSYHPWMHGTFAVLKNSHYSISGGDGGFSLPNLPPGKYTVSAYHESYGDQSQEVTIAGSETKTVNFVFKAKPY